MKTHHRYFLIEEKAFDLSDPLANGLTDTTPDYSRVRRYTASDDTIDRFGEVVLAHGVQLGNYAQNPVILHGHNHDEVIGKAIAADVRGRQFMLDVEFAPTEKGEEIFQLVKFGAMKAGSIGFIPHKFLTPGDAEKSMQAKDLFKQYPGARRIYTDWELMEFSIVSVPANPNAIAASIDRMRQINEQSISSEPTQADTGLEDDLSAFMEVFERKADEIINQCGVCTPDDTAQK